MVVRTPAQDGAGNQHRAGAVVPTGNRGDSGGQNVSEQSATGIGHAHRSGPIHDRSVAQLPGCVPTPAGKAPRGQNCAAVLLPATQRCDTRQQTGSSDPLHCNRRGPVRGRTITQLSVGVPAPTLRSAVGQSSAERVAVPARGDLHRGDHCRCHRTRCTRCRAGADHVGGGHSECVVVGIGEPGDGATGARVGGRACLATAARARRVSGSHCVRGDRSTTGRSGRGEPHNCRAIECHRSDRGRCTGSRADRSTGRGGQHHHRRDSADEGEKGRGTQPPA